MEDLKPCPFCGGEVYEEREDNIAYACCKDCVESWGRCGFKYEGRFKRWNTRATLPKRKNK